MTSSSSSINPNPSGFTDLDDVSWALTAINNLYVNGVINGKTDTLFYPNDSIIRAEFAKMLVLAFNFDTVSADTATFTDVPVSNWASEYVEAAYGNGIITGFDDGSFEPNSEITRQDMAVMVYRAATSAGYSIEDKTDEVTFTDDSIIAAYSKDAVSSLQKAN
ncbi:MAG: S-layer homology domain-containing protein, partial [Firmicutes bacterium]|nr:S-layer homology domain-containing protein [Bacillota bacterium]